MNFHIPLKKKKCNYVSIQMRNNYFIKKNHIYENNQTYIYQISAIMYKKILFFIF